MALLKQSTTYTRTFLMVLSSDHVSAATGKTVTVNVSKAGGTFAAAGGTVTEIANGWYKIALTTGDTGTLGELTFNCTATGCDPTDFTDQVVAVDFTDGTRLGLTALPNASAASAGGLPTVGTGSNQIDLDSSGRVNLGKWLGSVPNALAAGKVDSVPIVRSGTAQAGTGTTITLDAGASATGNFYWDMLIFLTGGTGAGQVALITSYNGTTKVATISYGWYTNPDATTTFVILPYAGIDIYSVNGFHLNNPSSGRVDCSVGAVASGLFQIKKNTALTFTFAMFDSTAHQLATGKTVTAKYSIDGGAQSTTSNSVVEISGGLYKIALLAAETNGTEITLTFTATGCDDQSVSFFTQA